MVSFCSHLAGGRVRVQPSMPHLAHAVFATTLLCLLSVAARADTNTALLDQWLSAQTNLHTWTADCIQTRSLPVLSQPLVSTGQVWVAVPDRFRWQLGQPAQTIALRLPDQLML